MFEKTPLKMAHETINQFISKETNKELNTRRFQEETGMFAENHVEAYLQWMQVKLLEEALYQLRNIATAVMTS